MLTNKNVLATLVALALILLAQAGCSSGGSELQQPAGLKTGTPQPTTVPWQLTDPSELAKLTVPPRLPSYVEDDLVLPGKFFQQILPHQLVGMSSDNAKLTPHWQPGSPFTDLAFCIYQFHVPDYDRNGVVRLEFDGTMPAAGDTWLALSKWSGDHWDWFGGASMTVGGQAIVTDIGSLDPYFDFGGDLLAVVALTGDEIISLASIRLGGLPPVAALDANPDDGVVPLHVDFDASGSTTPEGTITKYEWDFEGDGIYDLDSGTVPTASFDYSANGTYHPTVKVTNSNSAAGTDSVTVYAVGNWQHTWGRAKNDELNHVARSGDGMIYAAGSSAKPIGPLNYDVLLTKWTPTGEMLWAKCWDSGANEFAVDLVSDGEGHIYTIGSTDYGGDTEALVVQWNEDGTANWAYRFGGAGFDRALKAVYDSTSQELYIGGDTTSYDTLGDVFLAKVDAQGNVVWARYSDQGKVDRFGDLALRRLLLNTSGIALVADYDTGTNFNIRKLVINVDGGLISSQVMNNPTQAKSNPLLLLNVTLGPVEYHYYVVGNYDYGLGSEVFFCKVNGSGAAEFADAYDVGPLPSLYDMSFDGAGNVIVSGWQFNGINNSAVFPKFNSSDGSGSPPNSWYSPDFDTRGYGLMQYNGGMFSTGTSNDATSSFQFQGVSQTAVTLSFTDESTTFSNALWTSVATTGLTTDETLNGVIDSGGGVSDGMLLFKKSF